MNYLIVKNGVIENSIVSKKEFAEEIGAFPWYEGASIGSLYDPPPIPPDPVSQLRADMDYLSIMTGVSL